MSIKVFVPGRPGSGKSSAIRCMTTLAMYKGLTTIRVKDYTILQEMFVRDRYQEHKQFRQTDYGGFDVCDFSVLNTALEQLGKRVNEQENTQEYDIIFVEFARKSYKEAFARFDPALLKNAYFLFIESELDTCIERIYKRVHERSKPDYHFVSEYIMRTYYDEDNWSYMKYEFEKQFGIRPQCVKAIYNEGLFEMFEIEVRNFAENISQEILLQREPRVSIEAEQRLLVDQ